jgi:hypothetical protein
LKRNCGWTGGAIAILSNIIDAMSKNRVSFNLILFCLAFIAFDFLTLRLIFFIQEEETRETRLKTILRSYLILLRTLAAQELKWYVFPMNDVLSHTFRGYLLRVKGLLPIRCKF